MTRTEIFKSYLTIMIVPWASAARGFFAGLQQSREEMDRLCHADARWTSNQKSSMK
jgi:hypothetical protein